MIIREVEENYILAECNDAIVCCDVATWYNISYISVDGDCVDLMDESKYKVGAIDHVDILYSIEVCEHIDGSVQDPVDLFKELRRLLRV